MKGTRQSWADMRNRCRNPRSQQFKNYGARGISICDRWDSFDNFLSDMGVRPIGLTLDRIDNSGNYEPTNCRWATRAEQRANQRTCHYVEFRGETVLLRHLAARFEMSEATLLRRLKRGWSTEKAATTPPNEIYSQGGKLGNATRWNAAIAHCAPSAEEK